MHNEKSEAATPCYDVDEIEDLEMDEEDWFDEWLDDPEDWEE
jgi:hypothetical protein